MGLFNMEEVELMRIVFTNIQSRHQECFRLAAKIICHRGTEAQKKTCKYDLKENSDDKNYRLLF